MARFISFFSAAGVLVPVIFQVAWWIVSHYPSIERSIGYGLQKSMLMLWPSSFVMLAASQENLYFGLLLISIAVNVALYVAIGAAVWYGFKKHYVIIALLAAAIVIMWWKLLAL